jgi:hypothetical protein
MKLKVIQEHDDGSADVQLEDVEPQMMQLILQTGLLKLLEDAIDTSKKLNKIPALLKEKHG